jgi:hypothetical protein
MLAHRFGYGALATAAVIAAAFLAVGPREAAASQNAASADLFVAYRDVGCGYPAYRTADGACHPILSEDRNCQAGFHAVGALNGNGYRCVQDGY